MPIDVTYNLTILERATIDAIKADGQTAEEYLTANNTTPKQLDEMVNNFVTQGTLQYAPTARAIVAASIETPEKLALIQPHIDAINQILGLTTNQ